MKHNTIKKVLDYFTEYNYGREVKRALRVFFDRYPAEEEDPYEEGAFSEWFLYDFKMKNGRTPMRNFCTKNPLGLSKKEMKVYERLDESIYGIWEVGNVIKGVGLELVNIENNDTYSVKEYTGSQTMKKGMHIFGRVAKVGDVHELVGANPIAVPGEGAERCINELDELTPKTARDYCYRRSQESMKKLEGRVLDGGRCICSKCGKEKKMGGVMNPSVEPAPVCVDCMAESVAESEGISVEEAQENRKRMLDNMHAFREAIFERYLKEAGKDEFSSIDEANMLMEFVQNSWNNIPREVHMFMEKESKENMKKMYAEIDVDFSELFYRIRINAGKIGRNEPCPCGSGRKYKRCCGRMN